MKTLSVVLGGVALVSVLGACSPNSAPNVPKTSTAVVRELATALAQATVIPTTPGAYGTSIVVLGKSASGKQILTDTSGHTLYELKSDKAGVSGCNGGCASTWPPLAIAYGFTPQTVGIKGEFGSFLRTDGQRQVMYNDHPLYRYAKDKKPGETKGASVGGGWSVAVP